MAALMGVMYSANMFMSSTYLIEIVQCWRRKSSRARENPRYPCQAFPLYGEKLKLRIQAHFGFFLHCQPCGNSRYIHGLGSYFVMANLLLHPLIKNLVEFSCVDYNLVGNMVYLNPFCTEILASCDTNSLNL